MLLLIALSVVAPRSWTLVCGGDLMFNGISPKGKALDGISDTVRAADLSIANLEVPLTTATSKTRRKTPEEVRARKQFILKGDPAHAQAIKDAGFDLVSLGNNHSMDYGGAGLRQQLSLLEKLGIRSAGAAENAPEAYLPAIQTLPNGLRVGFISALAYVTRSALLKCTPAANDQAGIAVLNLRGVLDSRSNSKIQSWVEGAKAKCDFLIVGLHWGTERKTKPDTYQVQLGRAFAAAGADLVWGHHPHVVQGAELYRGVPILYSTGNLVSALPSHSALFRFSFHGTTLQSFEVLPISLQHGRTKPASTAVAEGVISGFQTSSKWIQTKHGNGNSCELAYLGRKTR